MNQSGQLQVRSIVNQRESGFIRISWDSGDETILSHGMIRRSCRCAECVAGRHDLSAEDNQVRILNVEPVGHYAVSFAFDDGHDRGIYPWRYLRDLRQVFKNVETGITG